MHTYQTCPAPKERRPARPLNLTKILLVVPQQPSKIFALLTLGEFCPNSILCSILRFAQLCLLSNFLPLLSKAQFLFPSAAVVLPCNRCVHFLVLGKFPHQSTSSFPILLVCGIARSRFTITITLVAIELLVLLVDVDAFVVAPIGGTASAAVGIE